MKPWHKLSIAIITALVGLLGGLAGFWGAYTAQKTLDLRHPIDQHEAMAKSFGGEISSAIARKDLQAVTRLRRSYEEYEEHWRTLQVVAAIVKPLEDLRVTKLSPAAAADLSKLVAQLAATDSSPRAPTTMGAAYLALNQYDSAASELSNVTGAKPLMLKAAAFGGLADGTSDLTLREGYRTTARDSLSRSLIASYNSDDAATVVRFAQDTPALSGLLREVAETKAEMRKPHKLDYDKKQ
jgi:hypothetical protein